MVEFDLEIDASGLNCPLPLLRLKKGLTKIETGDTIKIITTDPAAYLDIGVFVEQVGHKMRGFSKHHGKQIFYVSKK